jgi:hypothetical protein
MAGSEAGHGGGVVMGVDSRLWEVGDMVKMMEEWEMQRGLRRACPIALFTLGASTAHTETFPVKTAEAAIEIAKNVCSNHPPSLLDKSAKQITITRSYLSSFRWSAEKHDGGWTVETIPSLSSCTNPHLLSVEIPASGPYPVICRESMYDFIIPPGEHPCTSYSQP